MIPQNLFFKIPSRNVLGHRYASLNGDEFPATHFAAHSHTDHCSLITPPTNRDNPSVSNSLEPFQRDPKIRDALEFVGTHGLRDGEGIGAAVGEAHLGLEEELVVLDAPLSTPRPMALFVAEDEFQCVALGVAVGVRGAHKDVEILRLEVGGVAHVEIHVEIVHRVHDVHREREWLGGLPLFLGQGLDVAIVNFVVAGGKQPEQTQQG